MKIKELISKLSEYNEDADITLVDSEDITVSYICENLNGEKLTPKTTMQCFIEPMDNCIECASEYMKDDIRWCSFYDKPCIDVDECYNFEEVEDIF